MNKFILYITGLRKGSVIKGGIPKDWTEESKLVLQDEDLQNNLLLETKSSANYLAKRLAVFKFKDWDMLDFSVLRVKILNCGKIVSDAEPTGFFYCLISR